MTTFDARDLNLSIDKATLKQLYQTKPLRHAADMAVNWLLIIATIVLCVNYFHPLLYVFAVTFIGARQHALGILMHDATHFRFLKNRKWNDIITNWVIMYPIFSSIEVYRQNHLRHHLHLNTEDDPDWVAKLGRKDFQFPKSRQEFLRTVLSYFLLIKGISDAIWFLKRFSPSKNAGKGKKKSGHETWHKLAFYGLLIIVLTITGQWLTFLMYWVIPYLSTFFMFQYIRSVAEHFGELAYDHLLTSTRTVRPNMLERVILAPHEVGYHIEHHLYPGVPYYHLPQLHRLLMQQPLFAEKAHITRGYWQGLMHELGSLPEEATAELSRY